MIDPESSKGRLNPSFFCSWIGFCSASLGSFLPPLPLCSISPRSFLVKLKPYSNYTNVFTLHVVTDHPLAASCTILKSTHAYSVTSPTATLDPSSCSWRARRDLSPKTLALNSFFFCRFAAGFNTLDLPAALFSSDSSSDPPSRRRNWHGIVGRSRLLYISSALPCNGDGDNSSTSIQSCGSSVSSYHGGRNATIPPFVLRSAGRQLRSGWPAASQQTMASVHDSKSRSGLMPCVGSSAATHVRGEGGWEVSIFSTS